MVVFDASLVFRRKTDVCPRIEHYFLSKEAGFNIRKLQKTEVK